MKKRLKTQKLPPKQGKSPPKQEKKVKYTTLIKEFA